MTEMAYNAMSRRTPSGGEGAAGGESAAILGDAFQQVAQGLARLQEALQLQMQEAMRRQEEVERRHQEAMQRQQQEAECRLLEALRLQEQRASTALREAVGQMEAKLQEKDDAIHALEQRLEETQQGVTVEGERAVGLEGSAEGELMRLQRRMQGVEESLQRAMQKFFPRVDDLLQQLHETSPPKASSPPPPTTSTGETCGELATGEGAVGGQGDYPPPLASLAFTATSASSISPSTTASSFRATVPEEAARDRRGGPGAGQGTETVDERLQRQSVERRIRDVKEKVRAERNAFQQRKELLSAVRNGRLAEIQRLLDTGAEVNYVNKDGFIPLLVAVETGQHEDVVSLLLQRGADVNAVNDEGISAMHFTTKNDSSGRCVDVLVSAGGDVNSRTWSGATPLHWAADRRNVSVVRALLSAGARRDLRIWKGPHKNKMPIDCATSTVIRNLLRS